MPKKTDCTDDIENDCPRVRCSECHHNANREPQTPISSAGLSGSIADSSSVVLFTYAEAEKVLSFFADAGMKIESGSMYSAKGQIAQLLNGVKALLKHVERDVL